MHRGRPIGMSRNADDATRMTRIVRGYDQRERTQRAWSDKNPGNVAMRRELTAALLAVAGDCLLGGGRVLDVGCGAGAWLRQLAGLGVSPRRLHGIDLVPDRLETARRLLPAASYSQGSACTLEFRDATFDLVLLFVVLSSLPDRDAERHALREARRVLAPCGALAVYDMRMPSPNPHVRHVPRRWLASQLGPRTTFRSLTVFPPLARRLGRMTEHAYPLLARIPALRSHWLAVHRAA
jgi:ubiquinone/menaquinone biosynthesis C-methylase UbiE